ncbi:MAG TPA: hypothetical protein VM121_07065 [Acidimicrobiales bacterium]|nr:hypothetical protein [Acidimicrobiales bacterium]
MPTPQRSGASPVVLLATGAVIVGALIFAAVVNLVSTRKSTNTAGTDLYIVGDARSLSGTVARTGPLLFQDLLGNSRDIYVQHLGPAGGEPEAGDDDWHTFEAHAPGAPRRCVLRWEPAAHQFIDPCDRRTYPADGAGLTTFPTSVDPDGQVVVDLRQPQPPVSTIAAAPATTAAVPAPAPSAPETTVSPPPPS